MEPNFRIDGDSSNLLKEVYEQEYVHIIRSNLDFKNKISQLCGDKWKGKSKDAFSSRVDDFEKELDVVVHEVESKSKFVDKTIDEFLNVSEKSNKMVNKMNNIKDKEENSR